MLEFKPTILPEKINTLIQYSSWSFARKFPLCLMVATTFYVAQLAPFPKL